MIDVEDVEPVGRCECATCTATQDRVVKTLTNPTPFDLRLHFPCGAVIYVTGPMVVQSDGSVSFGGAA